MQTATAMLTGTAREAEPVESQRARALSNLDDSLPDTRLRGARDLTQLALSSSNPEILQSALGTVLDRIAEFDTVEQIGRLFCVAKLREGLALCDETLNTRDAHGAIVLKPAEYRKVEATIQQAIRFSPDTMKTLAGISAQTWHEPPERRALLGAAARELLDNPGMTQAELAKMIDDFVTRDEEIETAKGPYERVLAIAEKITGRKISAIEAQFAGDAEIALPVFEERIGEIFGKTVDSVERLRMVREIAGDHGRRLIAAQSPQFPTFDLGVVCTYGANIDYCLAPTSAELQTFVDASIARYSKDTGKSVETIKANILQRLQRGIKVDAVDTEEDVIVALLLRFREENIGKDKVRIIDNGRTLDVHLSSDLAGPVASKRRELGGGGIKGMLALERERDARRLFVSQPAPSLARTVADKGICTVSLDASTLGKVIPFCESGDVTKGCTVNYAVELTKGTSVTIDGTTFTAPADDKLIYLSGIALTDDGKKLPASKTPLIEFGSTPANIKIEILQSIGASCRVEIANGAHYAKTDADFDEWRLQLAEKRRGAALAGHPYIVALEVSSVGPYIERLCSRDPGKRLEVDFLSLNDSQLSEVSKRIAAAGIDLGGAQDLRLENNPVAAYLLVSKITKALGLKGVYIHSGEVIDTDISTRGDLHTGMPHAPDAMELEMWGGVFTKYQVAVKVLEGKPRKGAELHPNLKAESTAAMAEISRGLADLQIMPQENREVFYQSIVRDGIFLADPDSDFCSATFHPLKWFKGRDLKLKMPGAGDTSTANRMASSGAALTPAELTKKLETIRDIARSIPPICYSY